MRTKQNVTQSSRGGDRDGAKGRLECKFAFGPNKISRLLQAGYYSSPRPKLPNLGETQYFRPAISNANVFARRRLTSAVKKVARSASQVPFRCKVERERRKGRRKERKKDTGSIGETVGGGGERI